MYLQRNIIMTIPKFSIDQVCVSKQHGRRELRKITGSEILSLGCFQGCVQFKVFKVNMVKANIRNTRTRCEICSKLTIKTPERRHWRLGFFRRELLPIS